MRAAPEKTPTTEIDSSEREEETTTTETATTTDGTAADEPKLVSDPTCATCGEDLSPQEIAGQFGYWCPSCCDFQEPATTASPAATDHGESALAADEAGSGKTTNGPIGAANRDILYFIAFQKHEKAREYIIDEATPDGHFHLKGGEQPVHDCCMDAKTEADDGEYPECPTHDGPDEWPHMLPIYDEEKDDDERQAFEAIMSEVGVRKAIEVLDLDGGKWEEQFDVLESQNRVVGVHEYLALWTARKGRICFIDETPDLLADNPTVDVEGLIRAANTLNRCGELAENGDDDDEDDEGSESEAETFHELAQFTRSIIDLITGGSDTPDSLAALDAPSVESDPVTINRIVDPADLPEDVDPDEVEERTYREYKGEGRQYSKHYCHAVERELPGERLAKVKVEYGETIVNRMRDDHWEGTPLCLDQVFAAAVEAGLDREAAMKAVAVPSVLEYCPWCHSDLTNDNGARCCSSDSCDWHEAHNTITHEDGEQARASAWIETDATDAPINLSGRILPLSSELPDPADTIVLDATATPEKVGALFKANSENRPAVSGETAHDMPNLWTTQVLDGQYHASTISSDGSDTLRERIQRTIDTAATVHERPLYLVKKGLVSEFDFPENAEGLHYHAARGLNRSECDAVVCIGAPHADVSDHRRDAELLAMGRDDVRAGGDEHGTRRDAPNPPVYRKLYFEDDDGRGRAVATKHYTGLTGSLFRETREKELSFRPSIGFGHCWPVTMSKSTPTYSRTSRRAWTSTRSPPSRSSPIPSRRCSPSPKARSNCSKPSATWSLEMARRLPCRCADRTAR